MLEDCQLKATAELCNGASHKSAQLTLEALISEVDVQQPGVLVTGDARPATRCINGVCGPPTELRGCPKRAKIAERL